MTSGIYLYPCDRGNGLRGLHYFQLFPGATRAVCVYCGTLGADPSTTVDIPKQD